MLVRSIDLGFLFSCNYVHVLATFCILELGRYFCMFLGTSSARNCMIHVVLYINLSIVRLLRIKFVFYSWSDNTEGPQHNPVHQPQPQPQPHEEHQSHEVGDLVGFLQSSSGPGTALFCLRRSMNCVLSGYQMVFRDIKDSVIDHKFRENVSALPYRQSLPSCF